MSTWIPFEVLVQKIQERKFAWIADFDTKYLNIRLDTRDDFAVLSNREGKLIAANLTDLNSFFDRMNKMADENPVMSLGARKNRRDPSDPPLPNPKECWVHEWDTTDGWKTDVTFSRTQHEEWKELSDGFTYFKEAAEPSP